MGIEEGYSLASTNILSEITDIWRDVIRNTSDVENKLGIINKKLIEMEKVFNYRKVEIRKIFTDSGFPHPPKDKTDKFKQTEIEIRKVIIDKIRKSYPINKNKIFQRELIKLKWYEEIVEELLYSETSLINSDEDKLSKIRKGERIHHNLTSAVLNNYLLQQNLVNLMGVPTMPTMSKIIKLPAKYFLKESEKSIQKGEYLFSLIFLRIALELCFHEAFDIEKYQNLMNYDWKQTPYFGEILKGIENNGIELPIDRNNLADIYFFLSKSIHTGYREEFFVINILNQFITQLIEIILAKEYLEEQKVALVKYLNESN